MNIQNIKDRLKTVQRYGEVGEYECYMDQLSNGDYYLVEDIEDLLNGHDEIIITICPDCGGTMIKHRGWFECETCGTELTHAEYNNIIWLRGQTVKQ